MNIRQREILEEQFNIYEDNDGYELESWTDAGVNMFIDIEKNSGKTLVEQLQEFIENFDMDEEIELERENSDYRRSFTIKESIRDIENWVDFIVDTINRLQDITNNNEEDEELEIIDCEQMIERLKGVGVKDTQDGFEIMLMGVESGLLQKYQITMNIRNYDETDLFNICYEISNEIKNLYYNNNGVPSETQVKEVVRNIIVK